MRPPRRRARRRAWREAAPPERKAPHHRQSREPRGEARSRSTCASTGILSCEKNCEKNKTRAPGVYPWSPCRSCLGATSPQKLLHQADRLDGFRLRGVHLPGFASSLSLADQFDRVTAAGLGTCDRAGRLDVLRAAPRRLDILGAAARGLDVLRAAPRRMDILGAAARRLDILRAAARGLDILGAAARGLDVLRATARSLR